MALALLASRPAATQVKPRVYRVIGLSNSNPTSAAAYAQALEEGFRELGYSIGRNLSIEYLFSDGRPERLPALAAEIVRRKPDVIIGVSNAETAALQRETRSIPIVIALAAGIADTGFVASLSRPGGNITGITTGASDEVLAKWLELLREVKPGLRRVGVLWDPGVSGFTKLVAALESASRTLRITLRWFEVQDRDALEPALEKIRGEKPEALCVIANVLTFTLRDRIAAFVTDQRLPAISYMSEFADAGFLMSSGANLVQLFKRSAIYADKIFKGSKPADLPIEQPTKVETVVNIRTAKKLGLTIPQSLLLRTDRIIQ